MPATEHGKRAKQYALTSLELDPDLAEGHAALGHVLWEYDFEIDRAQIEFDRAFDLDPTYMHGYIWYAFYLISLTRFEEAAEFSMKAARLNRASPIAQLYPLSPLILAGRHEDALIQFTKTVEMFPNQKKFGERALAEMYESTGQWDLAAAIYDTIPVQHRSSDDSFKLAYTCFRSGQKERAILLADSLDSLSGDHKLRPLYLAKLWAARGDSSRAAGYLKKAESDIDRPGEYVEIAQNYGEIGDFNRAFYWIERMYEERISWLTRLRLWALPPEPNPICNDPRYQQWVEKLNLDT
jgi:tetratricopeptide (TPR) repeat protein